MGVLRTTTIIVVVCLVSLYLFKIFSKTSIISKKPSPDFVYPYNYTVVCYGSVYFLKKNGKIDSTYLIHFNYTNQAMMMNISYYGIYLRKRFKTRIPYFLINIILDSIRYDENLSYILYGNSRWYSMRFYYKNNKILFNSLLFGLEYLYPNKFKFLNHNYNIVNNSYVFMEVKNYYPTHIELYLAFKNNTSLFYINSNCFLETNPFLDKDI